ncbi:hypothetical protein NSQ29_04880 [Paenibacillus sp. FSL F4-0236]|uniref:hypothetical protein n=1 Tax=Paenibacillus sp. FSL F4-0236 TaxID=2954731 RepID=UPI0030F7B24E
MTVLGKDGGLFLANEEKKHITDMTLLELLNKYQKEKEEFKQYADKTFMKDVDEKDEVTKKRYIKIYDEYREEIMNTACFIAEKLLK